MKVGDLVEVWSPKGEIGFGVIVEDGVASGLNDLACYRVRWRNELQRYSELVSLFYIKTELKTGKRYNAGNSAFWIWECTKKTLLLKLADRAEDTVLQMVDWDALDKSKTHQVYYELTVAASVQGVSDHCVGRWFYSRIHFDWDEDKWLDYTYPQSIQEDGGFLTCGRAVRDFSLVSIYKEQ